MTETFIPVLSIRNGIVVTNSRDVAEFFGKRHGDVLRSIDGLDCSPEFNQRNFASVEYLDGKGEVRRAIDMTKDGFTFVCMGFTGREAAAFKEAYIARFNEMQDEIIELEEQQGDIIPRSSEEFSLRVVAETRRSFGAKAAQQMWGHLGLPVVPAMLVAETPQMSFRFPGSGPRPTPPGLH